jgi:hypothetical protein
LMVTTRRAFSGQKEAVAGDATRVAAAAGRGAGTRIGSNATWRRSSAGGRRAGGWPAQNRSRARRGRKKVNHATGAVSPTGGRRYPPAKAGERGAMRIGQPEIWLGETAREAGAARTGGGIAKTRCVYALCHYQVGEPGREIQRTAGGFVRTSKPRRRRRAQRGPGNAERDRRRSSCRKQTLKPAKSNARNYQFM